MEKTPLSFYTVRFNDCDPLGHLNNSRYLDYFLNAREDHLKEHYGIDLREWVQQGKVFVIHSHEIRYLRPAFHNEIVGIQSMLIGAGESSLLVEMAMFDNERQLKALMWTKFTRINARTGRKETHPPEFREWVQQVLVEGVDLERGMNGRLEELRLLQGK